MVGRQTRNGHAIPVNACPIKVIQYETLGVMLLSSVIEPGNVEIQHSREPMNVSTAAMYKPNRSPNFEVTNGATTLNGIPSPYETVKIRVISFGVESR